MLFSQFPTPATTPGPEGGVHSRPSRLRRLSNLRNYRAAVSGAMGAGANTTGNGHARSPSTSTTISASTTTAAAPSTRSPPDLHLTRSHTTSNNHPGSSSSSASSPSQQLHGGVADGNRLTLVNSSPLPAGAGAAVQTPFATANSTNDSPVSSNPTASQIRPAGETASLSSSRSASASTSSIAETTASETAQNPAAAAAAASTTSAAPVVAANNTEAAASTTTPTADSGDQQAASASATIMSRPRSSTTGDAATADGATTAPSPASFLPSLRLSAYYDPRSTRPSLSFPPISRTLPSGTETIRVGRYSERDSQSMANMPGNLPSAAPVGFKSKVVSRRHCEFWYENGKWYIKDVKSSSGTFLNHIRLSPPSQESKAFPINDGDIVQLGIDFKGGEEMIFRCVKMRLELNRGWQNKLNSFNVAAHKRLRTMGTDAQSSTTGSSDCSICLNSIAPCQSLFVAPCSHTWHFKCVRSLLTSPQYPIFICPNCRAGADLEADVDDPAEDWEAMDAEEPHADETSANGASAPPVTNGLHNMALNGVAAAAPSDEHSISGPDDDLSGPEIDPMELTVSVPASELTPNRGNIPHAVSEPLPIRNSASGAGRAIVPRDNGSSTPPGSTAEGPITPRNDAGPWVFDGSAGQTDDESNNGMRSLDAAADMNVNGVQTSNDASGR